MLDYSKLMESAAVRKRRYFSIGCHPFLILLLFQFILIQSFNSFQFRSHLFYDFSSLLINCSSIDQFENLFGPFKSIIFIYLF